MTEERKQVLAMLAEGKITTDEAERLLDKLGEGASGAHTGAHRGAHHPRSGDSRSNDGAVALAAPEASGDAPRGTPRHLRVEVLSKDGDQVSVRVPLRLIRTGIKLTTMLPTETNAKLAEKGIDLSELGKLEGEELVDALRELTVKANTANGDTVRVFCE